MSLIAAVQMASSNNVSTNLEKAGYLIAEAAKKGAKCVVLPEEFATLGLTATEKMRLAEPYGHGPIQSYLSLTAKKHQLWVVGGTIPLQSTQTQKIFSSCLVWDSQGMCVGRYDKIHLFDVIISEKETYKESACIQSGDRICVLPTPFGKIGIAICYDIRFPELFRAMALTDVQIFILPSAFTVNTGKMHWEVLLRARAIENLCYMVASNQVGIRYSGHGTFGNSMIISPWGEILAHLEKEEGVILANLDLEKWAQCRQQFPVLDHTRSMVVEAFLNKMKR